MCNTYTHIGKELNILSLNNMELIKSNRSLGQSGSGKTLSALKIALVENS